MRKKSDPRHTHRIHLVQDLFSQSFRHDTKDVDEDLDKINAQKASIDSLITSAAPQFPVDKIAKIDVAILRLAIYELLFEKKEPPKVIIDEAVELAKEFGGEGSPVFINGVLGTLYTQTNNGHIPE